VANDWIEFEDKQRRFGVSHPRRWRQTEPLSEDGAFACTSQDPPVFVEILCLGQDTQESLAENFATIWEENATNPQIFQSGYVMSRRTLYSQGNSFGARLVIGHKRNGMPAVTDHCILSVGQKGILIALQCKADDHRTVVSDFETMVASLSAPWFKKQVTIAELTEAPAVQAVRAEGVQSPKLATPPSQAAIALLNKLLSSSTATFEGALNTVVSLTRSGDATGLHAVKLAIIHLSELKGFLGYQPSVSARSASEYADAERSLLQLVAKKALLKDPCESQSLIAAYQTLHDSRDFAQLVKDVVRIGGEGQGRALLLLYNDMWAFVQLSRAGRIRQSDDGGDQREQNLKVRTAKTVLRGHESPVFSAAFSPDGTRIVTASEDMTARIWEAATAKEIAILRGHKDNVHSAAFSSDGARVVTASGDKTARIWDAATAKEMTVLHGHKDWVYSAGLSSDGARIVTASGGYKSDDNTVRIWDAATGKEIMILRGHKDSVYSASFSPDGARIVTAALDETARIWDAVTAKEITVLHGHKDAVRCATFSPDGTRIVTASNDKTVRIWNAVTGKEIMILEHESVVGSAAFSPDGSRIVTASSDDTARIWDAATGKEITVLHGHEGSVESAAFSPDGMRIVTASGDKTVRIWDAAT
jgi:predicted oxidoreductase (fatty acid repression mutant protein)